MRILIIEDEALAVKNLELILNEIDENIEIVGKLTSVRESVKWLESNSADLILLDIHLSDGLSFKIFESVEVLTPVILTTAYDQFAIKSFELNSIDYLIKPIKVESLRKSINKYKTLSRSVKVDYQGLINAISSAKPEYRQRFSINFGDKIKSIDVSDCACFYVLERSVFVCTFSKDNYDLNSSLEQLEKELDPKEYFRINRQMIINFRAIDNMHFMSNRSIKIDLKVNSPIESNVSILRLTEFKNWLNR